MGERSGEDGLLAQAEVAPLTGLAESLELTEASGLKWPKPLPETLRLTMHHYDIEWTRKQLIAMGATPLKWSIGNEAYQLPFAGKPLRRDKRIACIASRYGSLTRQEAASMLPFSFSILNQTNSSRPLCCSGTLQPMLLSEWLRRAWWLPMNQFLEESTCSQATEVASHSTTCDYAARWSPRWANT